MRDVQSAFVESVTAAFALGSREDVEVAPMVGSANRLWRFSVRGGESFVVKEFAHDAPTDLQHRRQAAAFEQSVFNSGAVAMPEPVPATDGELIVRIAGSRGAPQAVRVHRWLEGHDASKPSARDDVLEAAGASLQVIQAAGAAWSSQPTGSIRWWDVDPLEVLDRLRPSPLAPLARESLPLVRDALDVVARADELRGLRVYSHCDHKPENALIVHGRPAVLDWDECGHCHPHLEAVEAALRWAGVPDARQDAFVRFLRGYVDAGGSLPRLSEHDFAKWLAALLGWFSFQARRALGEWPADTADERAEASAMAADALANLRAALAAMPAWMSWWQ